jgi:hypothetical protein
MPTLSWQFAMAGVAFCLVLRFALWKPTLLKAAFDTRGAGQITLPK